MFSDPIQRNSLTGFVYLELLDVVSTDLMWLNVTAVSSGEDRQKIATQFVKWEANNRVTWYIVPPL